MREHGSYYYWRVGSPTFPHQARRMDGLKSGIHSTCSISHIGVGALLANDLAVLLHRRLRIGLNRLCRLGIHSADVPAHTQNASALTCGTCVEANSSWLTHASSIYTSSST